MLRSIGKVFFTGLLTVLPVLATLYLVFWLVGAMEKFFGAQLKWLMPDEYYRTGMGLLLALVVIFAVGMVAHAVLFRTLFGWAEKVLLKVPLVRSVYGALRDLFGLFSEHKGDEVLQVVSVTLPGSKMRLLGFITRSDFEGLPAGIGKANEVAVYLPMSYQIGGYMVMLPRDQAVPVDMTREEAMKFVLTAGLKTSPA